MGISAELLRGNLPVPFLREQGAAIGLTVSGLNHVAHQMSDPVKKSFRQQMRAKGIKPGERFGYTQADHNNVIGAVEELNDLYSSVSSKIGEIVYHEGGGCE